MFVLSLLAVFFAAIALASWFRNLDGSLWRDAATPLLAGVIAGIVIRFLDAQPAAIGAILTAAALYIRLTGRESEPADGMSHGALLGAAASIPLWVRNDANLLGLASCILAGAVAGYGITFGLTHAMNKLKQVMLDIVTAGVAIGAAYVPLLLRTRFTERHIAAGAVILVPLLLVVIVFQQWPAVRAELRHEAALGVIDDTDVRPTAHPFLRIGRGGWHDRGAHREFVRSATKIALRKRQQRGRSEEAARLYQLEVIKLRMQVQEMSRIDRAMRRAAATIPSE